MKKTRIKFCGLQEPEDVQICIELGVDAVGCIFAPSPRQIDLATAVRFAAALPANIALVGIFVNYDETAFAEIRAQLPRLVPQFCGAESPAYCERLAPGGRYLKVFHIAAPGAPPGEVATGVAKVAARWSLAEYQGLPVFDTFGNGRSGGTGKTFAWSRLARPQRPFVLAGGLTPENVQDAMLALRPYAVDVRSGIETSGRKNAQRMRAFAEAVRRTDEALGDPLKQTGDESTVDFFSEHHFADGVAPPDAT